MLTYNVSRLGLDLASFPSLDLAYAFVAEHCGAHITRLLTDYCVEAVLTK